MKMNQQEVLLRLQTGEILSSIGDNNTPIYATDSLSNAEFDIVAVNDVVTPDGTIRYLAGTIVDTLRTDSSGQDTTIPLFLGTYDIIETKAPSGFVLDSTPRSVTLYESQNVALLTKA